MDRTDAEWIADLSDDGRRRDEALADLRALMIRGLRRALRGAEESMLEDVTQEALLKALEKLDTFQGRSRFTTWAMTIAVHHAMTELRHRRWKDISLDRAAEDSDFRPERAIDRDSDPQRGAQQRAVLEAMNLVIARDLTDRQRRALLASVGGMPLEEVARQLGSNRNAVYKLTHDARVKLRDGLIRDGYEAGDVRELFAS